MASASTGCTSLMFFVIGFEQIVVHLPTAVVASMVAEGFRQSTVADVEYSYITWYCLSVLVSTISAVLCLLAVVSTWANIKHSYHGLLVWLSGMVPTCALHGLTMLAMLAEYLREVSMSSYDETSSESGLAVPTMELDKWRISATNATYLVVDCFGEWILGFGAFWCCILCINGYHIYLIQGECDNFIENHNNNTEIGYHSERNDAEAQTDEGRIRRLLSHQHIKIRDIVMAIEKKNRDSLYPLADLHNALAMEASSQFAPSAPPLDE